MTTPYTVGSNVTIGLFQYEPFSYTWTDPSASRYTVVANTTIAPFVSNLDGSGILFASSNGPITTTSNETLTIQSLDSNDSVLATSSNTVSVGIARFVDDVSQTLSNQRFVFYKNEPIAPTVFSSAFALAGVPISTPSLPAGIGFVSNAPTKYLFTGTPLLQIPTSNYNIIGSNPSLARYIPYCPISIVVNAERMVLDISKSGIVSLMQPGTAITSQSLYARCPPYPRTGANLSNIRYTWTPLPGGLEFADSSGTAQTSPFVASDPSASLVLRGTPTVEGAKQFADLGISSASVAVTATRTAPSPFVSASQNLTFSFGEMVLFDNLTPSFQFYSNVSLGSNTYSVRAQTYFTTSNVPITSIVALDPLPAGVTLQFVAGSGTAYFVGTPTATGTGTYRLRATNANLLTRDVSASIQVQADSVSVTGPVDVCYNFVLSRATSNALTGYYPSPITWSANAISSLPIAFSAPALSGTGLSLSVSNGTATLVGTPLRTSSNQNLRITATSTSGASNTRDVSFGILPDTFTFQSDPSGTPTLLQNRAMTPVRISATTLSGRQVLSYLGLDFVNGLSITLEGVVSGTPLVDGSGTLTVVASTGFSLGSNLYPYTISPDTILFSVNPNRYRYNPNADVSIPIGAASLTGTVVNNFALSGLDTSWGLVINSNSGLISGTLNNSGFPLGSNAFSVTAKSGRHQETLPATLTNYGSFVDISFGTFPTTGGPTITSPALREFTFYQYTRISPIAIVAAGTGTVVCFVQSSELPTGISFDPITLTFSGKSMEIGQRLVTIYVKDSVAVTALTLVMNTITPFVVREGGAPASAYTSQVRQYTVVNAARNAENNTVYPAESQTLGSFMRAVPPDEITATVDPKCYSTSNCP